jgi:hydrogenase maturation protease
MTAPVLVFGWGNPARGDDALGPLLVERIDALALPGVECLTDFQLQVEHALDLQDRQRVLFVDASVDAPAPFAVTAIGPVQDASFTTHAMSPQAVLQVYQDLQDQAPPPCWQLAIRAEGFELGEDLSPAAAAHLEAALAWTRDWLAQPAAGNS